MGVCNVLLTVCEAAFENLFSVLKSNRWVGDFQVATSGGFWVATRGNTEWVKVGVAPIRSNKPDREFNGNNRLAINDSIFVRADRNAIK
ncbi:hypothetical protein DS62_01745 [Smithella sp. SC_K08D17]|nr:hypothetical protein KD27_03430 [Smithella sp. D17]KIE17636.1 hypothetical protein DS62_01745 [Smithella sp. SC_K08D17]